MNLYAQDFYVSTTGDDANSGTKSHPFASLKRARDAVRLLRKRENIQIIIQEGSYYLTEPLTLKPMDSGMEDSPVIWRAEKNQEVILSGGKVIDGTWNTDDGKVWYTHIPEARDQKWIFRQLFIDGKRITRARFPNKSMKNPFLYAIGGTDSSIYIDKQLIKESWDNAYDAQINMVPNWKFFNQWNTIESVDMKKGEIHLKDSELHAEIINGNWFWIEGIKEELDEEEEWCLDSKEGVLYLMPGKGKNPNQQKIIAPLLNQIIYAKGDVEQGTQVKNIRFNGLEFHHTTFSLGHIEPRVHTDAAIMFENTSDCHIENSHFENIGGYAFWLHLDCKRNVFDNNIVEEAGGGGVLLTGARFSYMDDSKLFTPGIEAASVFPVLNHITNNTVKHCGKIRYYGGGVHLDSRPANMTMSPGNYIAHNHFFDLSRNGIFAFRNQGGNIVEYNHIHDVMQTTIDGACIHFASMSHLNAPNYILNNYLYNIWGYEQRPNGKPKRHLANGIFLDWATSNTSVKNNYIYNAGGDAIKNIMGNWNLTMEDNVISKKHIKPPYIDDLGPGSSATNRIDLESNSLTGNVIHYTDQEFVTYRGSWKPRSITGFWNLFSFNILETSGDNLSEITYNLPVEEDGNYQVSLMYLPDEKNASNAKVQIHHTGGMSEKYLSMKTGDKFGFAIEIGEYHFRKDGIAKVIISNDGADGMVVANSVAFVKRHGI